MGRLIILFLIAVLPVYLICRYIYNKDKNKEPTSLLVKLFVSGIASCFIVIGLTIFLSQIVPFINKDLETMNYLELLFYTFIVVALLEEGVKLGMVYLLGYRNNKEFDEVYDIIVYSIFVSLGFAVFENILYITSSNSITVGLFRGISSVPGHACFGLFMGYYLSLARIAHKNKNRIKEKQNIRKSILIPVLLHGLYDFCVLSGNLLFLIVFVIFIIQLYIISLRKLKKMANENRNIEINNKFCPNCGKAVTNNYCSNCGTPQE